MRLDLRPIGPAAYLPLIECPNGFIVYKAEEEFTPQDIEVLTALVADTAFQDARTRDMPSYRAFLQYRALNADESLQAWSLLRAAWEAEDAGNAEQRTAYLRDALHGFGRVFDRQPAGSEARWTSGLLIAEIRRQTGDFAGVAAALDALPLQELPADDARRQAAEQIRTLAGQENSAPAEFAQSE